MKLCHESDGAARFANLRATTASSEALRDWGGGSVHIDGVCRAAISAAAKQQTSEIAISFIVIDQYSYQYF